MYLKIHRDLLVPINLLLVDFGSVTVWNIHTDIGVLIAFILWVDVQYIESTDVVRMGGGEWVCGKLSAFACILKGY